MHYGLCRIPGGQYQLILSPQTKEDLISLPVPGKTYKINMMFNFKPLRVHTWTQKDLKELYILQNYSLSVRIAGIDKILQTIK